MNHRPTVANLSRRTRGHLAAAALLTLVAAFLGPVVGSAGAAAPPSGCVSVPGEAFHVAKTGSDSSSGSAGSPWRTISHAVDAAPSGATIVVHDGTYREEVVIRAKRLTLMSAPGETVWLSGSDVVEGWVRSGATWRATPANGGGADQRSAFDDKQMLESSNHIAGHLAMVFIDGARQTQVESTSDVVAGTFAVSGGVYHLGTDPSGKKVDVAHREVGLFIDDASGSEIIGIGVKHYATPDVVDGAVRVASDSDDVTIRDSVIVNNANVGLQVRGLRAHVEDNTIESNGRLGVSANNADDLTVRGNLFRYNNNERFATDAAAGGIKVSASRRVTIDANHTENNHGSGVWIDRSSLGVDIIDNRSERNERYGFHVEVSAQVRVVSNTSLDDTTSINVGDSNDVDIFNNVFAAAEQAISAIDGPRDSSLSQGGGFGLPHDDRYSFPIPGISWEVEDLIIRNNTLIGGDGDDPMLYVNDSTGDADGNQMASADHNLFHRGANGNPTYVVGWSNGPDPYHRYTNINDWKNAHGQGSGDQEQNGSNPTSVRDYPDDLRPDGSATGTGTTLPSRVSTPIGYNGGTPPIGLLTNPNNHTYGHCGDGGGDGGSGGGGGGDGGGGQFIDVPAGAFYEDAVEWLVATGATTGTSPNTFSPGVSITRGEMATFLHRLAGTPAPSTDAVSVFADVAPGAFYTDAVGWLIDTGATTGTSPTSFSPSAAITRGEAATLLHRLAGVPAASGGTGFTDVVAGAFYTDAISWLVDTEATSGTTPTTFSPARLITRGEAATLLYRLDTSGDLGLG